MDFFSLFMQADFVVKTVMLGLLFASIWAWAIIFEKMGTIRRVNKSAKAFEETFWSGGSLERLYERLQKRANSDPIVAVFVAGMREWQTAVQRGLQLSVPQVAAALQDRVMQVMQNTIGREMNKLERRMTFLASLGSAAPFIGLFGTVWGIMNSFIAIAAAENTSLNVVAPAIAEALLATGFGLVAAIPAVLAYNKFASDFGKYGARLEAFIMDFNVILSRNLYEGTPAQQLPKPSSSDMPSPPETKRYGT
ncbi:MAG TPA: protein TolQ [Alphaproteobacteria bacterium]|nr:protein TolQ [Alphaproteobacteria bacterium]